MSNDPVRTELVTTSGERLDFQTYFVRHHHATPIGSVSFAGSDDAAPAPGVIDAITGADVVIVPPSNPLISVAPVLAVPGVRDALASADNRIAVSPIVGGKALKGPADALMRSLGHEVSAVGVARIYKDLVDVFVIDETDAQDAAAIESLDLRPVVCDTIMSGAEEAAAFAKEVIGLV
jgi:LPPG:FO 2-phospho-L-lactate transferase